jgi:hypothetical protein
MSSGSPVEQELLTTEIQVTQCLKPHYVRVPVGVSSAYFLSAFFPAQKDYKMSPSDIRHM